MKKKYRLLYETTGRNVQGTAATVCMLVFCLVFCAVLFWYSEKVQATMKEQIGSSLRNAAAGNARTMEHEISDRMVLFERIAAQCHDSLTLQEQERMLEQMKAFQELYGYKDMGIATEDGIARSVQGKTYEISEMEFFRNAMKGMVTISSTMEDPADGGRINVYSAPVSAGDTVYGVVYAICRTEDLIGYFRSPFEDYGYSYVVDADGNVMAAENGQYENILELMEQYTTENREKVETMREDLKNGRSGNVTYEETEIKHACYGPVGINGWSVVTIVPAAAIMRQYKPIIENTRGFCLVMGFLCMVAVVYFQRQQKKQFRQIEYYAYTDPLTGGKNNIRFLLDAARVLQRRPQEKAAVLSVDINRFRMINQMLGIEAGNRVICAMDQVLQNSLRDWRELCGHRVADRFLVLWLYADREELIQRLEQLCRELTGLSDEMENIFFHAAVGVYEVPETRDRRIDENYVEKLCGNALMAGQTLKDGHTTAFQLWDEQMKQRQMQNKIYENEMYPALERKEFVPWFQPKVDLRTGEMCGAEALVRWKKPDGTLIPPGNFVPFFEANGFIERVDRALLEAICRYLVQWKQRGLVTVPISVNLSRAYLYSETFASEWKQYLEERGLDVSDIRFEITETAAARDRELMRRAIHALHTEGFKVLLDDFGTGYSSLAALQELDFDILKLDCSFVRGIGEERTEKILEHVIRMAASLEMETIAEGVETEEQYQYLKAHGVDMVQGYYCWRPMPPETFEQLLRAEFGTWEM